MAVLHAASAAEASQTAECTFLIKKKKAAVYTNPVNHVLKV